MQCYGETGNKMILSYVWLPCSYLHLNCITILCKHTTSLKTFLMLVFKKVTFNYFLENYLIFNFLNDILMWWYFSLPKCHIKRALFDVDLDWSIAIHWWITWLQNYKNVIRKLEFSGFLCIVIFKSFNFPIKSLFKCGQAFMFYIFLEVG